MKRPCRLPASGSRCICLWRRSAIRGGPTWRCSATNGSRRGGQGIEGAFHHFGGRTRELLLDNAKPLVNFHDAQTREVRFNERFHAFCRYWDVMPKACAPYRARTKGKDERGVGYVKRNAIAGHRFDSLAGMEAHLAWWMREVADLRVHGTTGEPPIERFEREEARSAAPAGGHARTFQQIRELRPPRAHRCLHRAGHQPLQRAVAAHRRDASRVFVPSDRCACSTPARKWPCHAQTVPASADASIRA